MMAGAPIQTVFGNLVLARETGGGVGGVPRALPLVSV
jgi:hypothetical protein